MFLYISAEIIIVMVKLSSLYFWKLL